MKDGIKTTEFNIIAFINIAATVLVSAGYIDSDEAKAIIIVSTLILDAIYALGRVYLKAKFDQLMHGGKE